MSWRDYWEAPPEKYRRRILMTSSRIWKVLTHLAAGILGAVLAVVIVHTFVAKLRHARAQITLVFADQYVQKGELERAILALAQATGEDPYFYAPYQALGELYAKAGHRDLAIEMYERALEVFDKENDLSARYREYDLENLKKEEAELKKAQTNK
jgi:Tfp pilus assembly protein PilF